MKKIQILFAAAALSLGLATSASAQNKEKTETRTYPSWFVGVQGGGQAVLNGYSVKDVLTPIGAVQGGAWFSPALGSRLQVNGWKSKEGIKLGDVDYGTYKFDYVGANVDVMVNLTNAFSRTDNHLFNVILLGGIGINKAWGHNYEAIPKLAWNGTPNAVDEVDSRIHNHVAHNDRVGLILDFRFNNNWSVSLEGTANHIGSRTYAINYNAGRDWQLQGLVGVTYTFGKKAAKPQPVVQQPTPAPKPAPVAQPTPVAKPKPQPKPKPTETQVVKQLASTQTEIYFEISQVEPQGAEAAKVKELAAWLKNHPTATATISGYADAGTGNAEINKKYATQRAATVERMLVEEYGIDAARLSVASFGDTVQPKSNNEENRVVICVAKEK